MVRRLIVGAFVLCLVSATGLAQEGDVLPADATVDAAEPSSPWGYHFTLRERLIAAQACVSEASWAGARRMTDCGGILQVLMERRRPARYSSTGRLVRRAETFAEVAERTMRRFFGGRTSRAWALALRASPIRENPIGWPEDAPPATHYSDSWRAVYARTQRFIDGEEPLPCTPTPRRWGGRVTDHDSLAVAIAEGWAESDCGEPTSGEAHATVNVFLYAVDPE